MLMLLQNGGIYCARHINLFYSETHSVTAGPFKSFYPDYKTQSKGKCYLFNVGLQIKNYRAICLL